MGSVYIVKNLELRGGYITEIKPQNSMLETLHATK